MKEKNRDEGNKSTEKSEKKGKRRTKIRIAKKEGKG